MQNNHALNSTSIVKIIVLIRHLKEDNGSEFCAPNCLAKFLGATGGRWVKLLDFIIATWRQWSETRVAAARTQFASSIHRVSKARTIIAERHRLHYLGSWHWPLQQINVIVWSFHMFMRGWYLKVSNNMWASKLATYIPILRLFTFCFRRPNQQKNQRVGAFS